MQQELAEGGDLAACLTDSLNEAVKIAPKPSTLPALGDIFPLMMILVFLCCTAYAVTGLHEYKYRYAELDPDDPENFFADLDHFSAASLPYAPQEQIGAPEQPDPEEQTDIPVLEIPQQDAKEQIAGCCTDCGAAYLKGVTFCPRCGAALSKQGEMQRMQ